MAFTHSFLLFSLSSSSYQPHHHLLSLHPFLFLGSSEDQRHEDDTKVMVTDRNTFINEIPQSDVCECRWKYKLEQMCLILLWNVNVCSREKKNEKKEEDKSRDIAESPEVLSRYVRARLLPTNTKGLVKVAWILTGLKHALVFQLFWLLGRQFKLCWTFGFVCELSVYRKASVLQPYFEPNDLWFHFSILIWNDLNPPKAQVLEIML